MTSKAPPLAYIDIALYFAKSKYFKAAFVKKLYRAKSRKTIVAFFLKRTCRVFGQAYGKIDDIRNIIFLKNKYFSHKKYKK